MLVVRGAIVFFYFSFAIRHAAVAGGCLCRRGNTGVDAGSGGKSAARLDAFATFTEATVGYRLQGKLRLDALPNGTPLVEKRT